LEGFFGFLQRVFKTFVHQYLQPEMYCTSFTPIVPFSGHAIKQTNSQEGFAQDAQRHA